MAFFSGFKPFPRKISPAGRADCMQGHWHVEGPSLEQIEASFSSLGVQVMITELDVDVLPQRGQPTGDVSAVQDGGDEMNPSTRGLPDHM
jgi:endo-1,4-beta-xylanase